jgi:hypothetical protein
VAVTETPDRDRELPVSDREGAQEHLQRYGLDRFISVLPTMPATERDVHFDPTDADAAKYYVTAPVTSLADLKLWTGIPNDHVDHTQHTDHLPCVNVPRLASIEALKQLDAQVIADAEYTLLNGYVDDKLLSQPFWGAVAAGLVARWPSLAILALSDLIVHDGQTVTLSNTPTAYFNKVTVYGSGTLDVRSDCKVIAKAFEYIVSPEVKGGVGGEVTGRVGAVGRTQDRKGR